MAWRSINPQCPASSATAIFVSTNRPLMAALCTWSWDESHNIFPSASAILKKEPSSSTSLPLAVLSLPRFSLSHFLLPDHVWKLKVAMAELRLLLAGPFLSSSADKKVGRDFHRSW